jgi:hypothetical protein
MGIRDLFASKVTAVAPPQNSDVEASVSPVFALDSIYTFNGGATQATREEAMSIPTIARARGIICSSIASIGLQVRDNYDRARSASPRVIRDPDPRVPGSATYVWTAEDLLFYGYAYWQITELFADTLRVRSVQRIVPTRVGVFLNQ